MYFTRAVRCFKLQAPLLMKAQIYFVGVLVFSVLVCAQNSPADGMRLAVDCSKWQPYETQEPKSIITIESVEPGTPVPAQGAPERSKKRVSFQNKWTDFKDKLLTFFGLKERIPAPFSSHPRAVVPETATKTNILQVKTMAKARLEGITTCLNETEPGNTYIISAYLKGFGTCAIFAYDGKWTYGERKELSDKWQRFEIKKHVEGNQLNLTIISDSRYQKEPAIFYVDNVEVVKQEQKVLPDAEVKPVLCQAEDFVLIGKYVKVVQDSSARGNAYVEASLNGMYLMSDIPFPQTAKPVFIYIRAWTSNCRTNYFNLNAMDSSQGNLYLPEPEKWIWAKFEKPFTCRRIGERFSILGTGEEKYVVTKLDAIVLTTRDNLNAENLDMIMKE